jgi:hypothetical protein
MGRIGKGRIAGWRKRRIAAIERQQLEAFRKKFGRDPLPGEPMFFDPEKDVPTPLDPAKFQQDVLTAMGSANLPPELAYAFKKTGLILVAELMDEYPPETVAEYDAAIDEYFELKAAGKLP